MNAPPNIGSVAARSDSEILDAAGKLVGIVSEGDFIRRREIGTGRTRPMAEIHSWPRQGGHGLRPRTWPQDFRDHGSVAADHC